MSAVVAILKHNFLGYFRNPTGAVFITLFVLAGAYFQFIFGDELFARNLANLDPLNSWFPYLLLFFAPAITMGAWAEERKQGTDELLLTLPATDLQVVLGKYLACVGIYLVALSLSLCHVVVLGVLGRPDLGLVAANFAGYAMLGAALIAVGMVGSLLTESMTVGFILGSVFCAALVLAPEPIGARAPFEDFASGRLTLRALAYCAAVAVAGLYANLVRLGVRHNSGDDLLRPVHRGLRAGALAVIAFALPAAVAAVPVRLDLTSERLHSLAPETLEIVKKLDASRPIYVQAFVSPKVPKEYVQTRDDLLRLLREIEARSGGALKVRVVETLPFSPEARDAEERFGIQAEKLASEERGRFQQSDVYLGAAFACGGDEVIVPFFHRGIPVEYELVRSIQVAARAKRLRVGVLRTEADLMGGMDWNRMAQTPAWSIVAELKKQYEVVDVAAGAEIPDDLNVLLVALPSSLTQPELDKLVAYVERGKPVLLLEDPLPFFSPALAPSEPKGAGQNPFMQRQQPPPKGRVARLYERLGVRLATDEVVFSKFNPHPQLATIPPEVVFVARGNGAKSPLNPDDPVVSGLQEVVTIFGGRLAGTGASGIAFTPLLATGEPSGTLRYGEIIVQQFPFGRGIHPFRRYRPEPGEKVLAARVEGTPPGGKAAVKAIVVADLDMLGEQFFALRRRGTEEIQLDNVTFVLNAVDVLAGDDTFVSLRKRRAVHRTLERVEERTRTHTKEQLDQAAEAETKATGELEAAKQRLREKVDAVSARTDLDQQTKSLMIENLQEVENRRFDVEKQAIEDRKRQAIEKSRFETEEAVRAIERRIQLVSVLVFPVPASALALIFLLVRAIRARRGGAVKE